MTDSPPDSSWNRDVREGETEAKRADRNFADLLQELRVTLTGSQILFAFLLVVPFGSDFHRSTTSLQRGIYIGTLMTAALSAGLLVAPAAMHRIVFRQHLKDKLVRIAGTLAIGGQMMFVLALASAVLLVVDYLYGLATGVALSALLVTWYFTWFYVVPLTLRSRERRLHRRERPDSEARSLP